MSRAPFAGLRPPGAPPELRARVLAACRERTAAPDLLDRLWASPLARAVWLAAVALLLVANLALTGPAAGQRRGPSLAPGGEATPREMPVAAFWHPAVTPAWSERERSWGRWAAEPVEAMR